MKIVSIVGAHPQLSKVALVSKLLRPLCRKIFGHTGKAGAGRVLTGFGGMPLWIWCVAGGRLVNLRRSMAMARLPRKNAGYC